MSEQNQTITLDGVSYEIASFSQGVQSAIGVYNKFSAELQVEQLAVMKTQAALQSIGAQIADAMKKELAERAERDASASVVDTESSPAA